MMVVSRRPGTSPVLQDWRSATILMARTSCSFDSSATSTLFLPPSKSTFSKLAIKPPPSGQAAFLTTG